MNQAEKEMLDELTHIVKMLKDAITARERHLMANQKEWGGDLEPLDFQDSSGRSILGDMYVSYAQAYLARLQLRKELGLDKPPPPRYVYPI